MAAVAPLVVELHPVAGIPPEYCEFLPKAEFEKCVPWLLQNRDGAWLQANASNYAELFADQKSEEVEEKLKDLTVAGASPGPSRHHPCLHRAVPGRRR